MKNRKMILTSLLLSCLAAYVQNVSADGLGTTAAQILEIAPDAKTAGMADTYCGLNAELSCLYYNPAGMASAKNIQFTSSSDQWQGMNHQYFGIAYNLHDIRTSNVMDMGTISFAFSDLNSGPIDGRNASGGATGSFTARDQLLIFSYAKNLYQNESLGEIAAGASAKFVTEEIRDNNAKSIAVDGGLLWKMPLYNACVGLTRQNTGQNMKYVSEEFALPANTKLSLSTKALYGALTLNLDLNKPDVSNMTSNIAAEYIIEDTISLRLGYNNKYTDTNGLTTGIGVTFKQLDMMFLYASEVSFDYAFIPGSELGNVNIISVTMKLGAD
jgi:hypothetical protein